MIRKIVLVSTIFLILVNQLEASYLSKFNVHAIRDYFGENRNYAIGSAILGIVSVSAYLYLKKYWYKNPNGSLKGDMPVQKNLLSNISDASLTTIYQLQSPLLEIPIENLNDSNNLKALFEQYQIITGENIFNANAPLTPWNNENWTEAFSTLIKRAQKKEDVPNSFRKKIHLDQLPKLLEDAKSILKSFLSKNIHNFPQEKFIMKDGALGRLFTYTRLRRAIEKNKITHVHLPLKILVIRDKKNGKYITGQTASQILDNIIKISIANPSALEAKISAHSEDYELVIFAARQENKKNKLNVETQNELKPLTSEVPFDVGDDNIFSDSNGDAIIIDTEFKGEPAKSSLRKLERYF